jgi:hypothetical protein
MKALFRRDPEFGDVAFALTARRGCSLGDGLPST